MRSVSLIFFSKRSFLLRKSKIGLQHNTGWRLQAGDRETAGHGLDAQGCSPDAWGCSPDAQGCSLGTWG